MPRRARWELWAALGAGLLLFALLRFRAEGEPDLGWHLAQGRLLWQGQWLRTNALAWTAPDHPWVDTSWLFDIISYLSVDMLPAGAGALGPKLVSALFFALTLAFLGLACGELCALGVWLLPALALLLAPRATPRPHVAAWAVLACVLWLCLRASRLDGAGEETPAANSLASQASARRLRLFALIPLWLGAQLHAGAAFAIAPLGLFSLEAFLRTRARRSLAPALLAPLALVVGPAGPASLVHLLRHWNLNEVVTIDEFQPWTWKSEPLLPIVAAAALLGLFLARPREGNRLPAPLPFASPALCCAVLLFAALAFRTLRLVYECLVVSAPALALLFEEARARQGRRAAALALFGATLLCMLPHQISTALGTVRFDPRWNERTLPVRAARFLDAHAVDGPGFNGLRDGGYLAWARPGAKIFIDARIHAYPPALWRALGEAEKSGPAFDRFLREQGAEWALATRQRERMGGFRLLDGEPGWALVYWDETSELFLRRDQPQFAALIDSFEYKLFHPWGQLLAQLPGFSPAQLAALDQELARYLSTSPGDATALLVGCLCAQTGRARDAEARCAEAERAVDEAADPRLAETLRALRAR